MRSAYVLLAGAVLCWAGNFVIGRGLRDDAPAIALTFWRWALALVVLAPFTFSSLHRHWSVIRRSWKIICLLGSLATVFQHIPIYLGLQGTSATNAALLNSASPVFIVLLSMLLLGERLHAIAVFGSLLSIAGVVTIISRGDPQVMRALQLNSGDIWILVGTIAWAAYTVCLRWRPPELRGLDLLTLIAAVSVIAIAPLYILEVASGHLLRPGVTTFAGIAYVGMVATVLAYIAWNRGVEQVGPPRAAPFMYLMLVFTPILSIVFLGEQLHLYHLAGATMIITGIYLTTLPSVVN